MVSTSKIQLIAYEPFTYYCKLFSTSINWKASPTRDQGNYKSYLILGNIEILPEPDLILQFTERVDGSFRPCKVRRHLSCRGKNQNVHEESSSTVSHLLFIKFLSQYSIRGSLQPYTMETFTFGTTQRM
jgi:hypothetical protein